MLSVTKLFSFESAHWLTGHPNCGQVHGHSFRLEVTVAGPIDAYGMVVDFNTLKDIVQPFVDTLDHDTINEVMLTDNVAGGWDHPTAERLLSWFADKIEQGIRNYEEWPKEARLIRLRLYETAKNFAEWVPDPKPYGPYLLDAYDYEEVLLPRVTLTPEQAEESVQRVLARVRKEIDAEQVERTGS